MYPSSTYGMNYQIETGGTISNGPTALNFTTGHLPSTLTFPTFTVSVPPQAGTDTAQPINIHSLISFTGSQFLPAATDLSGNIVWYYDFPTRRTPPYSRGRFPRRACSAFNPVRPGSRSAMLSNSFA